MLMNHDMTADNNPGVTIKGVARRSSTKRQIALPESEPRDDFPINGKTRHGTAR